jgi:pyruvate ferredoxin oxidoreductase delta subunit
MGMEKYEYFVRRTRNILTYDPGWSRDNRTGAWRAQRPEKDDEACTRCGLCWLFCPDGIIDRETFDPDLDYCKGCGICAVECKVGAIRMVREGEGEEEDGAAPSPEEGDAGKEQA